jgi:ADP-heptose:LPS heptosyltransferase
MDPTFPEEFTALAPPSLPGRIIVGSAYDRRALGTLAQRPAGPARMRKLRSGRIRLDQVGSLTLVRNGRAEPLLAGIIAVRGRVRSRLAPAWITVHVGGIEVARERPRPVPHQGGGSALFVFNIWLDSAKLPAGRHRLSVSAGWLIRPARCRVTVAQPQAINGPLPYSDALVPSPASADLPVEQAVLAAPAEVRPATSAKLLDAPNSILVLRVDQLGDVAVSLPAMRRLRQLYPAAHITALVQQPCASIVAASAVADEILTIDLDYDREHERRYLSVDEERRLRASLASRKIDLAIDLSPSRETRPLLLLSGADYLVGFDPDRFDFLDFGIRSRSRDKANRLECVPHGASVMMLVDGLATAVGAHPVIPIRRQASSTDALARHGLTDTAYVVLHTGASRDINRWPASSFRQLTRCIAQEFAGRLVVFHDDDTADWLSPDRLQMLGHVPDDVFDAIISNAHLFIGNDSGPKHLAALRGVPTISLHVGRLNWSEWGQVGEGSILSKRVPCAGCCLSQVDLCGREAACLTAITVEEVMEAARPYLTQPCRPASVPRPHGRPCGRQMPV